MRSLLAARQWKLTKSLGQNFLHDQNQLRRIVAAGELKPGERVLEVGPGLGPLTEMLLDQGAEVTAVEKDRRLAEFLKERFAGKVKLTIIHDDALGLRAPPPGLGRVEAGGQPAFTLWGRLFWLNWRRRTRRSGMRMVATLQLEVAQRIGAAAGSEHYGLLGLLLGLRYESRGSFKIPASCFFPAPDVDSACITLVRRAPPLLAPALHENFTRIVKRAFSQRRKTMMKLLKQDWPEKGLAAAYASLGLSPQARAEEISLERFVELANRLRETSEQRED